MRRNIKLRYMLSRAVVGLSFFLLPAFHPHTLMGQLPVAHQTSSLENLGFPNWSGEDYLPIVSPDGKYLIFQSDRPGATEGYNFWYTTNVNYLDRVGRSDWTIPIPLRFPLEGEASKTMQVTDPPGTLKDPPGAFSINSDDFEGAASIVWRNNKPVEIFFTSRASSVSKRDGFAGLNIYFSRYRYGRWSVPVHLNVINSDFDDRMPAVSQDGATMIFSSNRPDGYGGWDLWMSRRNLQTGIWSRPVNMGPDINSRYDEISPSLCGTARTLFFSSNRPGGFGYHDIYVSRMQDEGNWSHPENLGEPFNSSRDDEGVSITADNLWLYMSSDRRGNDARGGFDLYRTRLPDWLKESVSVLFAGLVLDEATRLPLGLEATIRIQYEKENMILTSRAFNRSAEDKPLNNFEVALLSGRVYRVIVSAPGYYPQELLLDYTGNVPEGAYDRRVLSLQPVQKESGISDERISSIPGVVTDASNGLPLAGSTVEYIVEGEEGKTSIVDRDGRFFVAVPADKNFTVVVQSPGYEKRELRYDSGNHPKEIVVKLNPIKGAPPCPGNDPRCIDNIRLFFPVNDAKIPASERDKVIAIANILKRHPDIKIEVQGHTDRTYAGPKNQSYPYNLKLSLDRARAVMDMLQRNGIQAERLAGPTGFSYMRPLEKGDTEKMRALNRRVEFRRVRP